MILSICDLPDVLKVMRIVNIVITIIKVVVPIMLIVSAMIDFARAVSDSELNKITKPMVNKVIAAILVFLIPTFVKVIANFAGNNGEYEACLGDITIETIRTSYINQGESLVKKAEESGSQIDYSTAESYLMQIEDETKRKEFEDRLAVVKKKIDENNTSSNTNTSNTNTNQNNTNTNTNTTHTNTASTDYGKNIPITNQIRAACNLVLNDEKVKIRLVACDGANALPDPYNNLPGGATLINGKLVANETISFAKYRKGMFTHEIGPVAKPERFVRTFFVMYTGLFLYANINNLIANGYIDTIPNELSIESGTCAQEFWETNYKSFYDSGAYRSIIDNTYNYSRYYILVNSQGGLIEVRYDTHTGILERMDQSAAQGKDIPAMVEDLRTGHGWAANYADAHVYDCRNILK